MGVFRRALRRAWLFAATAALCLQSLFPSGYMPADLSTGWVAMICPDGLPAEFVRSLQGDLDHHHHHHHHHSAENEPSASTADCQLGGAIDQPVSIAAVAAVALDKSVDAWRTPPRYLAVAKAAPSSYRSRAPPRIV